MEHIQKMNVPYTLYQLWSVFSQSCPWGVRLGVNILFFWRKTCQIKSIIHDHVDHGLSLDDRLTPPKICCQILQKAADQVWSYFILRTTWLGYAGNYHELIFSLSWNILKKIPTQKNQLAKFSHPKKSGNQKFQTTNNSLITPITWNLEYPPGSCPKPLFQNSWTKYEAFEVRVVLLQFLLYSCKLNSFSKEWFCTQPCYKSESFLTWTWPTVNIIVLPAGAFPFLFPSFFNEDLASELVDSINQEGSLRVFCNGCAGSIWGLDGEAVCSPHWEKNHKKWNNNKRNNNNNNNNIYYYSFNQHIRFWLAEIPQIIHHNQPVCWPNGKSVQ